MEPEQIPEEQVHKKGRHRKKQLYNSILQQMEFYFSDSNLAKDRFLSQLIRSDPYIDIDVFLKFNKLRKLTTNVEELTKALGKSKLIELSEDKTKVRRKLPLKIKENVEECTIYVERLKSDATHDWLTTIFSEFGNVVYVSIPRYKHNGMIKGFAFVEFEDEEGPKAALEYFESIDCKLPSVMEPHKLCSIATFEGDKKNVMYKNNLDKENADVNEDEQKSHENGQKEVFEVEENPRILEKADEIEETKTKTSEGGAIINKRKHSNSEISDCESEKKKVKTEEKGETIEDVQQENKGKKKRKHSETNEGSTQQEQTSESKRKKNREKSESETNEVALQGTSNEEKTESKIDINEDSSQQEMMSEAEGEEKKKKKHKKSHRKKMNLKEIGIQILSKADWKKMRNRYLDMQRKTMKQLKMHLNRQRFANRYDTNKTHSEERSDMETAEKNDKKENSQSQFIPGIIVKVSLSEPCEDNKKLKTEVKACSSEIKYVDIPQPAGSEEIYVRFSDNKNAQTFCASNFNRGKSCILDGNEEKMYWEKIETAREAKQKRTVKQQRGRDKLLKKAERQVAKHVRFDDSE